LEDFIMTRKTLLPLSALLLLLATLPGLAQKKPVKPAADTAPKITTPKEQLGFNLGDDYQLATYTQLGEYWTKLAKESPRMKLVEIGKTEEGRPHWMAIVTSPENQKNLEHYREISYKLAHAEGLTEDQAHALANEGKAVIWIDGSLHATEVVGGQQLMEMVYQMVSRTDPETMRILNDVIILFVDANPDGHELVTKWYMRDTDPLKRSMAGLPRLYSKYTGHDDNRDFYMSAMSESTNMNKVLYLEWCPQIMYNHHQTGPVGTVLFAPPFRPPHNYNLDPLTQVGLDLVGAAMHDRFIVENKPGSVMRKGTTYSTWFNGGLRTTTYFHNMIGLLTEIIGSPTPMEIPFRPERVLPNEDLPFPIAPGPWHFRQSIDYSVTANRAVLDLASRMKEEFLYNIYLMGRNSIERGNQDHWTLTPRRMNEAVAEIQADMAGAGEASAGGGRGGRGGRGGAAAAPPAAQAAPAPDFAGGRGAAAPGVIGGPASLTIGNVPLKYYESVIHDPKHRDARGYILPSDQPDFLTATKFINTLVKNGIDIHRATAAFTVSGKSYPAGSWVVKCSQAFRPHILDMFEPQYHPDDIPYPGGPPTPPYDAAGYTLAYTMGVQFDRIVDKFDGPFEKISGFAKPPAGSVGGAANPAGYTFSHAINDSFIAVNRLLKAGESVMWIGSKTMYVAAKPSTKPILDKLASDFGLSFTGVSSQPSGEVVKLKPVRIGLVDTYGGSMPSGWTRFIFDQFEFPYQVVFSKDLDAGNLNAKFDVLVFPSGTISAGGGRGGFGGGGGGGGGRGGAAGAPAGPDAEFFGGQIDPSRVPAEYQHMVGRITPETTLPQIRKFIEAGGTAVAVGPSTSIASLLNLPLGNHLVEHPTTAPLSRTKYYVPGSVLRVAIDNTNPVAYGYGDKVDIFFDNSPVYDLEPSASLKGVKPLMWFDSETPLRSGWAWGEHYLKDGVTAASADVGKGKVYLFSPEITFRSQPHGTYKLLFNSIYYGPVAK
jgi:hypothetical protein